MARVVPSVLWVVVLVSTNSILALDCNTADIQVKEGQTELIGTVNFDGLGVSIAAYVKPESDFQGISVDVRTTQGNLYTAWFPAQECFTITHQWMTVGVYTGIWNNSTHGGIVFAFSTPTCLKGCKRAITPQSLNSTSMKAYGPSRWRKTPLPEGCDVTSLNNNLKLEKLPACQDPPSYTTTTTTITTTTTTTPTTTTTTTTPTTTTTTTTTTTIIIAVSTTAVVVVVVMVLFWKCKFVTSRRAGSATAEPHLPHHTSATHSQQEDEDHIYDFIEFIDYTNTNLNRSAMTHHQGARGARGVTRSPPPHHDDDNDDVYEEPRQEPVYEIIDNIVPHHLQHDDDVYEEPRQLALYENIQNVVPHHLQHDDDVYIQPRQEPLYNDVDNVVSTPT